MKLKDFLTLKVGAGVLVSGTRYNPYINYSWSQTLTVGVNQQIKDTGTSGLNLQQFFGQGCWFNGIDMQITIPVNATIQTEIKSVNGVAEINTNTQVLTNYNVYSGSGAKVYKDLYMFNRLLTQSEIEKYTNNPNQFFMDSLEDSSCILAMPMCEKDGFVRNYKSYSEGSNLVVNGTFEDKSNWSQASSAILTISDNKVKITTEVGDTSGAASQILNVRITSGEYYILRYTSFSTPSVNNGVRINGTGFGSIFSESYYYSGAAGKSTEIIFKALESFTNPNISLYATGTGMGGSAGYGVYKDVSLQKVSSIHQIANYLTTCRTNAQRLSYGLQTSGFKRDSKGLILSKSNFLEADGVGYGNTGWIPKWNEDFTVESVFEVSNDSEFRLNGNGFANGIFFGNNSIGKNLYVRVFGSTVIQLANTKDIICLIFSYNWQTKEVKQYVDGVLVTTQLATQTTNSPVPVLLGLVALGGSSYPVIKPLRLFKTHSKALTQGEITKNFNKYQAQGLLSESGLLFPDNALVDESGNFILDENNNFIIVE